MNRYQYIVLTMEHILRRYFLTIFFLLSASIGVAQTHSDGFFRHRGKLIIIGGGAMPDNLFHLFAKSIGGKEQAVAVIPLSLIQL